MRNTRLFTAWRTMGLVQKRQYYGLLTGLPVLANTSFNENEPIVCSPE